MKCNNCGSRNIESTKGAGPDGEFTWCDECGSKDIIEEKGKIKHSGEVVEVLEKDEIGYVIDRAGIEEHIHKDMLEFPNTLTNRNRGE